MRRSFIGLLAFVLVLTAQTMAGARAMPDAAGHMVLCTQSGNQVVYTDADGQPTGAGHLCHDCMPVFFGLGAGGASANLAGILGALQHVIWYAAALPDGAPGVVHVWARGPPFVVI